MMNTHYTACISSSDGGHVGFLKNMHSERNLYLRKTAFVWLNERLLCVGGGIYIYNKAAWSEKNTKMNVSASWHLKNNLILSCLIRKHKSALPFYPRNLVCLIISCDRCALKSSLQSTPIWSFLCETVNPYFFCFAGVFFSRWEMKSSAVQKRTAAALWSQAPR